MTPMVLCQRCGSIRIARGHSTLMDRVIALLTAKRPFVCRRCGLRMRKRWTRADLEAAEKSRPDRTTADKTDLAIEIDLDMANQSRRVDLAGLDAKHSALDVSDAQRPYVPSRPSRRTKERSINRRRAAGARRRDIIGGLAVTSLVLVVAFFLVLTGSCGGSPPEI
jgi:hypothetical protein